MLVMFCGFVQSFPATVEYVYYAHCHQWVVFLYDLHTLVFETNNVWKVTWQVILKGKQLPLSSSRCAVYRSLAYMCNCYKVSLIRLANVIMKPEKRCACNSSFVTDEDEVGLSLEMCWYWSGKMDFQPWHYCVKSCCGYRNTLKKDIL